VLIDDANREVLITDFGLARIASRAQAAASLARGAHGTPLYMPPEQWGSQAFGPITPVADVYSLGVILFEMLAGQAPFSGSQFELMTLHCTEAPRPPSGLRFGLDPKLDAICLKALEKQPANRYRSAKEFADALSDYLRGGGGELIEALPLGDEIDDPAPRRPRPAPPPLPWAEPLPEPAAPRKRPGPSPSASTASHPESTIEEKEVVRCPKCNARLEVKVGRGKPIDCPMCNLKFAVEAGRQAAARSARAGEREKPPSVRRDDRRDERRDDCRDDRRLRRDDDGIPPWHWKPAARGLRVVWVGMLLCSLFAFGLVVTAIAAANDEPPSRSSDPKSRSFTSKSSATGGGADAKGARDSSDATFRAVATLLGVGMSLGLVVMGAGRVLAGRLPEGVRGGTAATLSAVAGWAAAACAAVPFMLIHWLAEESRESGHSGQISLSTVATITACAAVLLLLIGEVAFNSYLSAIGRRIRGFPRGLVIAAKLLAWVLLACVAFGGGAAGFAGAAKEVDSSTSTGPVFIMVGAMCFSFLLLPAWGLVTLWLNVHAAVVVGRHAHARG
jgi:hypothetical protein